MSSAPEVAIDLSRTAWTRPKGDLTLYGTWILTTGRPAMVIVPSRLVPTHDRVTPCIVPIDTAYMWDEYTGDPGHCARMTYLFASSLGINPHNPMNLVRLTSLIRDHLGDLLTMPPLPHGERVVVADAILTETSTGKTREAEIMDHV